MKRNQVLILFFLVCILLLVCLSFFTLANSIDFSKFPTSVPSPPTPTIFVAPTPLQHNPTMAQIKCERAVKNRLKSPSTAKFSSVETYSIEGEPANYHAVTGLVEAQNSYGVPLLSYFRCDLHYVPERSGEWVLDNLEIEQ